MFKLYQKFLVRKHERALLFRDGDFVAILEPGVYRRVSLLHRYTVDRVDLTEPLFEHRLADFLVENYPEDTARHFEVVATGADEIAIVYVDERVETVLGPAERKLFAKGVHKIRAERFEIVDNLTVDARLAKRLVAGKDARLKAIAGEFIHARIVPDGHVGLLYVDGELTRSLAPGFHAFFAVERGVTVSTFDTRVNTLEVSGQEILTKDKVSLRINLALAIAAI